MKDLLKYTYLLEPSKVEKSIERLWTRYQKILDNKKHSWEDLNEARAILYFIGYLYPERIALECMQRRISHIMPKITLDKFLSAIDHNDKKILKKYQNNGKFIKLKNFYLVVKKIKNRVKNNSYLDEERFNKIYSKLKPQKYL